MLLCLMHLSPVDLHQAPCDVPSWCRIKPASCGEQEVLELCLKVWSFLQQVSCLELCQDGPGQRRSSTEHPLSSWGTGCCCRKDPTSRYISAGIWDMEVSPLGMALQN